MCQVSFGIHEGVVGGQRGITGIGLFSHDLIVGRIYLVRPGLRILGRVIEKEGPNIIVPHAIDTAEKTYSSASCFEPCLPSSALPPQLMYLHHHKDLPSYFQRVRYMFVPVVGCMAKCFVAHS